MAQLARPGEDIAVSVPVGDGIFAVTVMSAKAGNKLLLSLRGVGLPANIELGSTGWPSAQNRASLDRLGNGSVVIFGSTPLRPASVWVSEPSGRRFRATLGQTESQPGLTFFAAVVPGHGEPYRASARDKRGRVLATWPIT